MNTSVSNTRGSDRIIELKATGIRFTDSMVYVSLNDKREIGLPLSHPDLRWLANASPEQRARWAIAPGGWCVLWQELEDGIEVEHLLQPALLTE
jgi:hypothetical protein